MTKLFPWRISIHWMYEKCIQDLEKHKKLNFMTKDFTALLCGVSGEITADEFIKFALNKNPQIQIKIIDYEKPQINAIKKLVTQKYKGRNIDVWQSNALHLRHLRDNSINWIETDGFLEYFDNEHLQLLFNEWKRVLKKDGFITLREFASGTHIGKLIDYIRVIVFKIYLGGIVYIHTKKQLEELFRNNGFSFTYGLTPYVTYRRYSLYLIE